MVQSLQSKGREFASTFVFCNVFLVVVFCGFWVLGVFLLLFFRLYSIRLISFIIDVPRSLSNVLWIIIFQRLMRKA